MKVVPFAIEHYDRMTLQPHQAWIGENVPRSAVKVLARYQSFTALDGDEVLAIGGLMELHPSRAHAWVMLSTDIGGRIAGLHRVALRLLRGAGYHRIETTVQCDFPPAHRWVTMLGFEVEAPCMAAYDESGRDHALYRWRG